MRTPHEKETTVIYAGAAIVVGILFVAGLRWIANTPVEHHPCRRIDPEAYDYAAPSAVAVETTS